MQQIIQVNQIQESTYTTHGMHNQNNLEMQTAQKPAK